MTNTSLGSGAAALLIVVLSLSPASEAVGQSVHGLVIDQASRPVGGVVVQLQDTAARILSRALTNTKGEFRVAAPEAGTYRLKTMRIGFRPTISSPIKLTAGSDLLQRIELNSLTIGLDTVRVRGQGGCRTLGDTAASAFAVWDQIRIALAAAELATSSRHIEMMTVAFERVLDPDGQRVRGQTSAVHSGYLSQPWLTMSPDSLHRDGYVATGPDNVVRYYAPGLDMLQSPLFVEDHCFKLIDNGRRLGLGFEPNANRRPRPEIRGVLWMDRATSELRSLEFGYANLSREEEAEARGEMDFVRLANGAWAISRWNIRMPALQQLVRSGRMGSAIEVQVVAIHTAGGELLLAMEGTDTLWARAAVVVRGVVYDSATHRTVAGAKVGLLGTALADSTTAEGHFTIVGAVPGEYMLEVHTRSLDSVNTVHQVAVIVNDSSGPISIRVPSASQIERQLCGRRLEAPGIIVGRVSAPTGIATPNTRIAAEWIESLPTAGDSANSDNGGIRKNAESRADSAGVFRFCGLPTETWIDLHAGYDDETAPRASVRISPQARVVRAEVSLRSNDAANSDFAVFAGIVVDSIGTPVPAAEVSLPDLRKGTVTDDSGAFLIFGIPAGSQRVAVRRVGMRPIDTSLVFSVSRTVRRRIELRRIPLLDSVIVTESPIDRSMGSFEDNRRLGLGHFFTRADLAEYEGGTSTSAVIQATPGLRVMRGRSGQAWILGASGRAVPVDDSDRRRGATEGCFAQVYIDNMLVYHARDREPLFDINSISPSEIEAIEYYANPAQTPAKYTLLNSTCGVLVVWTRRSR